jgi:hypothetical protein
MPLTILTSTEDNGFTQYFYQDFELQRIIKFEELKTQKGKYKETIDVNKYKNFEVLNNKLNWVKIEPTDQVKNQIVTAFDTLPLEEAVDECINILSKFL